MAQNVIDVFAQEVEAVAQNSPNYCNVAIDGFHDGMTVWWHGTPSPTVLGVLARARQAGITPVVLDIGILMATPQSEAAVRAVAGNGVPLHFTQTEAPSPA